MDTQSVAAGTQDVTVIEDNGGGITLQITDATGRRWQHTYTGQPGEDLAFDLRASLASDLDLADWDGDEQDEYGWLDPSGDEIQRGAYRVLDGPAVLALPYDADALGGSLALRDLVLALRTGKLPVEPA